MANPSISRDCVHALAEACSEEGEAFQSVAARLMKSQRRLSRFFEQGAASLGKQEAEVSLYMCSVCLRVFDQVGGRMYKVSGRDLEQASAKIGAIADSVLPADGLLPERVRQVEWRAQPHLLDEILWALYEKKDEDVQEGELDIPPEKAAVVFMAMWVAVEALDARWHAPKELTC